MNSETLQLLIQPRTDVNECINANTHTFVLDCYSARYACDIALPCTDGTVCSLLSDLMQFNQQPSSILHRVTADEGQFYLWTEAMQSALANMRTGKNLAKDLVELAIPYKHNNLQLVKYLKNKYQFGLKETKELVDLYYLTL